MLAEGGGAEETAHDPKGRRESVYRPPQRSSPHPPPPHLGRRVIALSIEHAFAGCGSDGRPGEQAPIHAYVADAYRNVPGAGEHVAGVEDEPADDSRRS